MKKFVIAGLWTIACIIAVDGIFSVINAFTSHGSGAVEFAIAFGVLWLAFIAAGLAVGLECLTRIDSKLKADPEMTVARLYLPELIKRTGMPDGSAIVKVDTPAGTVIDIKRTYTGTFIADGNMLLSANGTEKAYHVVMEFGPAYNTNIRDINNWAVISFNC